MKDTQVKGWVDNGVARKAGTRVSIGVYVSAQSRIQRETADQVSCIIHLGYLYNYAQGYALMDNREDI